MSHDVLPPVFIYNSVVFFSSCLSMFSCPLPIFFLYYYYNLHHFLDARENNVEVYRSLKVQFVWFSAIVPLRMQNATAASFSPLYYVPFVISCAVRVSSPNSKFWKISSNWGWSSRSFHLLTLRLHPLQLLWFHCPSFWNGPRICLEVCPTFSFTILLAILPQTLSFRAYGRTFSDWKVLHPQTH